MVQLAYLQPPGAPPGTVPPTFATPVSTTNAAPLQVIAELMGAPPGSPGTVGGSATVMWTWQAGTAAPPPQYLGVYADYADAEEPAAYTSP